MQARSSTHPATTPQRWPQLEALPLRTVAEIRAVEGAALAHGDPLRLMRQAGQTLARLALALAPHAPLFRFEIGPGHNGGDGLVAAAELARAGRRVEIVPSFDTGDLPTLPSAVQTAWAGAVDAGCRISDPGEDRLGGPSPQSLLIDALLGIGARRPPAGRILEGVHRLRRHAGRVLAVDLPTGLDANTGEVKGEAVRATDTLSFIAGKPGLFTGAGRDHAGKVWIDDLGLADHPAAGPVTLLLGGLRALPPRRRHADHKGTRGDVIVLGGASGMEGAAELAACAAHAAGAGRVWRAWLSPATATLAGRPELMRMGVEQACEPTSLEHRTLVAGCGGGTALAAVLAPVLAHAGRLVLDADGLNAVALDEALQRGVKRRAARGRQTVVTPHPLEAARLLGWTVQAVQGDRLNAARTLAERFEATVVLKGSGTVIATPDGRIRINATGGPALATAGTGDVLAGWLGGLWAGFDDEPDRPPWEAASTAALEACRLHGAVAEPIRAGPLRAADLIERMWAEAAGASR